MIPAVRTVLDAEGAAIIKQIQDNLASTGTNATGKTSKSLRFAVGESSGRVSLVIRGRSFFNVVETGRGPRKSQTRSDFFNNFLEWMDARGIKSDEEQKKRIGWAKWMINRINRIGSRLFRRGGRKDIVSNVITPNRITQITKSVYDAYRAEIVKQLKEAIK